MSLDRKFNEDSKNVLKNMIRLLKVAFTSDFVPNSPFKPPFWQFITWHHFSPRLYLILYCFLCHFIGNLMRISKMCLKHSFIHSKWVLKGDLVPNCPFKPPFWQFILWHHFSPRLYQIL